MLVQKLRLTRLERYDRKWKIACQSYITKFSENHLSEAMSIDRFNVPIRTHPQDNPDKIFATYK